MDAAGQLGHAERRRGDRPRRHGPGSGILAAAVAGRAEWPARCSPWLVVTGSAGSGPWPGTPVERGGPPPHPRTRPPGHGTAWRPGVQPGPSRPGLSRPGWPHPGPSQHTPVPRGTSPAGRPGSRRPGSAAPPVRGGSPGLRAARAGPRHGRPGHADRPPRPDRPAGPRIRPGAVRVRRPGPGRLTGRVRPAPVSLTIPAIGVHSQADQAGRHRPGHPPGAHLQVVHQAGEVLRGCCPARPRGTASPR